MKGLGQWVHGVSLFVDFVNYMEQKNPGVSGVLKNHCQRYLYILLGVPLERLGIDFIDAINYKGGG